MSDHLSEVLEEISALVAPGESSYEYPDQLVRMVRSRIEQADDDARVLADIQPKEEAYRKAFEELWSFLAHEEAVWRAISTREDASEWIRVAAESRMKAVGAILTKTAENTPYEGA